MCVGAEKMKDLWSDGSYWGPSLLTHLVPVSGFPLVIVPEAAVIHCPRSPALGEAECQSYALPKYHGLGPRGTWPCGSTVWYHKVSSWEGGMQTDIPLFPYCPAQDRNRVDVLGDPSLHLSQKDL